MRNRIPGYPMDIADKDLLVSELEEQVAVLRKALADSNQRNQRLISLINKQYGVGSASILSAGTDLDSTLDPEDGSLVSTLSTSSTSGAYGDPSFVTSLWDRGSWLASLLLFQSFSSFILAHHEVILKQHPTIVFYLTALVGAGGNAGNQAAVRIIRAIALGQVNDKNKNTFLRREFFVALALSFLLGFVVVLRTFLSACSFKETVVILTSIFLIVFISINLGALIPLMLQRIQIDPAHASTTIQVIMDISGVLITCRVAQYLLGME